MTKVCTSGYFNPLHKGHLRLLEEAKRLGDYLVVIVNNDAQIKLKGSKPFMDEEERMEIIRALRCVDEVMLSIDTDTTITQTLGLVDAHIFAKGGDSTMENIPRSEQEVCDDQSIEIVLHVGGDKIQSSSWLKENL